MQSIWAAESIAARLHLTILTFCLDPSHFIRGTRGMTTELAISCPSTWIFQSSHLNSSSRHPGIERMSGLTG